ncbi:MAG TPA: chemotaxis-specific protein-glutamate methyltransferase CheB [Gemmatimonadales bacterium]|nr:chemotaxis-specific protein-glutamate methyltransferase CheB [Gemmatimonadales bacterium]
MIGVFVVDDSAFVRKAIARVLAASPGIRVVGEAATGAEALERIPRLAPAPDLVTLDVAMPGLDGLAVLRGLHRWRPELPVLMLSAHTRAGAEATLEALAAGAADFIDKSRFGLMDLDGLGRELTDRIRALAARNGTGIGPRRGEGRGRAPAAAEAAAAAPRPGEGLDASHCDLCVLGASTGGPAAIQHVLERLPADFPLPMAVVQHMPPGFTRPFADRLNGRCRLRVSEAVEGDRLAPGRVLIAPAGLHLRIRSNLTVALDVEPADARHVPSVDVLMRSAAAARPGRALGVLLTGMGDDGADGMAAIRAGGGVTVAESESSCVVYGMPRAAWERGGVCRLLPLAELAEWLAGLRAASPEAGPARR